MKIVSTDHCVGFCLKTKQRNGAGGRNSIYLLERVIQSSKIIADVGEEGLLVECPPTAERMGSGRRWEGSAWLML